MRVRCPLVVGLSLVLVATVVRPLSAELPPLPIRLSAFAVNMTTVTTARNGIVFDIQIKGWSTEAQRQRLIEVMATKGQDAGLKALQKEPVKGRISIPGWTGPDPQNYRLGWNLRYTWHESMPDGVERIVIGTDRQMSMWEVMNRPRTYDYPFTFIEIRLPKDGKGEGRMIGATKLLFDKDAKTITLEQYSGGTVRLSEVSIKK
jgi:hypothetical protein